MEYTDTEAGMEKDMIHIAGSSGVSKCTFY